jgi:hypothetical protein
MIRPQLTVEQLEQSQFSLDNPGYCLACGAEYNDCDPDTRKRECEECGERKVYGLEQLVMMGCVDVI